jgi:hypothetical protein
MQKVENQRITNKNPPQKIKKTALKRNEKN